MLVQVLHGGKYFNLLCTEAPNESQLFPLFRAQTQHWARLPLRSAFARGAASVKGWKVKLRDQKAWQSWRAATPPAALCIRRAMPGAPCNAAPLDLAAGEKHEPELLLCAHHVTKFHLLHTHLL